MNVKGSWRGRASDSWGIRNVALSTLGVVLVLSLCTMGLAQNPSPMPGQVGQQTVLIEDTAHDFGDGAGPGGDDWLGAGDNTCTPCHGIPADTGGVGPSTPVWNHDYDAGATYDGKDWLYTKYDGTVSGASTFDVISKKCLGCHDPDVGGDDRALQDYTGYSPQYNDPVGVPAAISAFADGGAGTTDVATAAAHSLAGGEHVNITGTTNYDGQYVVVLVDATNFNIDVAFVGDDATGDWQEMGPTPDRYVSTDEDLGDNLSVSHHPVGIDFTAAMGAAEEYLVDPTTTAYAEGTIKTMLLDGDKITCNSCHEQHNDRRFDLYGNDYHDDPVTPFYGDSELHNFLKVYEGGCRLCHTSSSVAAASGRDDHHMPGREDPFGDLRGGNPFNCDMCHRVDETAPGWQGYIPCAGCHTLNGSPTIVRNGLGVATTIGEGHHGGDRDTPYIDCVACHGDPVTGLLTGNNFGSVEAPSCFSCHDYAPWLPEDPSSNQPPVFTGSDLGDGPTGVAGVYRYDKNVDSTNPGLDGLDVLEGTVNEALVLEALASDPEEQPLSYTWSFGDGSLAQFPSFDAVTAHTYEMYNRQPRSGPKPAIKASLAVTDGVNPPINYEFDVLIYEQEQHVDDTWHVTTAGGLVETFDITFEERSGSLVVSTDQSPSQLSFGIEFVGVIYWMELWMDLGGDWGTGDVFFGNLTRGIAGVGTGEGSMDGVVFRADGSVDTFTATGGAQAGGH